MQNAGNNISKKHAKNTQIQKKKLIQKQVGGVSIVRCGPKNNGETNHRL